jgi:hypothetical protein
MSTWINNTAGLLALAALAACATGVGGIRSAAILNGQITVQAPTGYCIDPSAGSTGADSAVVLMGRCNAAIKQAPAVLTLSAGQAGSAGAIADGGEALAAFFATDDGRAALSRDGLAADVEVVEAFSLGDAYLMRVQDRAVGEYWRGIVGLRGRVMMLSVSGPPGRPLSPAEGRALLEAGLAALRRANVGGA